jgi:hypothetical protein
MLIDFAKSDIINLPHKIPAFFVNFRATTLKFGHNHLSNTDFNGHLNNGLANDFRNFSNATAS